MISYIMLDGKKQKSKMIVFKAISNLSKKTSLSYIEALVKAVNTIILDFCFLPSSIM
jgi:ribosomal protein S7